MSFIAVPSLTDRDKRALAIAAGCITLLVATRLAPPLLSWRRKELERARLAIGLASAAPVQAQRTRMLQDSLVARRVRLAALDSAFVSDEGNRSAAARLAELVTAAAERTNVLLSSVRIEPTPDSGASVATARVRVHASLSGDLAGIARLVAVIERPPRLLAIRQLAITQRDATVARDRNESLEAEMLIEGLTEIHSPLPTSQPNR